ncbi:OLC1v1015361C2 [Oldenlandia corymbosa var. corymbosa]|nr:OLC1v1015361C2 [Oldenlandia corymbosa var. corymbosa]
MGNFDSFFFVEDKGRFSQRVVCVKVLSYSSKMLEYKGIKTGLLMSWDRMGKYHSHKNSNNFEDNHPVPKLKKEGWHERNGVNFVWKIAWHLLASTINTVATELWGTEAATTLFKISKSKMEADCPVFALKVSAGMKTQLGKAVRAVSK